MESWYSLDHFVVRDLTFPVWSCRLKPRPLKMISFIIKAWLPLTVISLNALMVLDSLSKFAPPFCCRAVVDCEIFENSEDVFNFHLAQNMEKTLRLSFIVKNLMFPLPNFKSYFHFSVVGESNLYFRCRTGI